MSTTPFAPLVGPKAGSSVPAPSYQNEEDGVVSRTSSYDSTETVPEPSKTWVNVLRAVAFVAILGATFLLAVAMSADYPSQYINSLETARLQQAVSGDLAYASLSSTEKNDLFESFKKTFNKVYKSSAEEDDAFDNFKDFLKLVDDRNTAEAKEGRGTGVHGITKFADMSQSDFTKRYLTFKKNTDVNLKKFGTEAPGESEVDSLEAQSDRRAARERRRRLGGRGGGTNNKKGSEVVDWSGVYTTGVNDQGYCGSCWAFSAVQQLESDSIRSGLMSVDQPLSVQQLVSCDTYDYGCDGGYPVYGYKFIYDNGGVVLNASYPYVSYYDDVPSCQAPADNDNVVTLTDFYYFKTEAAMEAHVQSTGPLSICIDATDWSSYTSGVLSTCSDHVNHCVQAVGINSDEGYWFVPPLLSLILSLSCAFSYLSLSLPLLPYQQQQDHKEQLGHRVGKLGIPLPGDRQQPVRHQLPADVRGPHRLAEKDVRRDQRKEEKSHLSVWWSGRGRGRVVRSPRGLSPRLGSGKKGGRVFVAA